MTVWFDPIPAVDHDNSAVVADGAVIQLFDYTDTSLTTPLTVTDANGIAATSRVVALGAAPGFNGPDTGKVWAKSGDWVTLWQSTAGLEQAAADARDAAESAEGLAASAQSSAESAASSAAASAMQAQHAADESVKTINGVGPDSNGNVNVSGGGSSGIGIGNVTGLQAALDDKADKGAAVDASQVNAGSGRINAARLGTGTGTSSNFLRGDGTWAVPPSSGEGGGTSVTVNGQSPDDSGNIQLSKTNLSLGNVDNTSDAAKPVSTAQQAALDLKADDTSAVHKTGNETVAGVKTFSSAPVVPNAAFSQAKISGLTATLAGKASVLGGLGTIQQINAAEFAALDSKDPTVCYVVVG